MLDSDTPGSGGGSARASTSTWCCSGLALPEKVLNAPGTLLNSFPEMWSLKAAQREVLTTKETLRPFPASQHLGGEVPRGGCLLPESSCPWDACHLVSGLAPSVQQTPALSQARLCTRPRNHTGPTPKILQSCPALSAGARPVPRKADGPQGGLVCPYP